MSNYFEPLLYLDLLLTVPAAVLSMIIWFVLKKRESVWLMWLYRVRCVGAASYVVTGALGFLDEEGFTRHSEGGQSGVKWFVSSLFIAWLVARKWGKRNSAGMLRRVETAQPCDASGVAMNNIRDDVSAEPAARKNTRSVIGVIAFLVASAAAWYIVRDAVIYMRTPSPAQLDTMLHDGLVKKVAELKSTLPKVLDEATTLRDIRVDGLMTIYINEIHQGYELPDVKPVQDLVTPKVCASSMRKALLDGASYRYEYWSAGSDSKLLVAFDIRSCP